MIFPQKIEKSCAGPQWARIGIQSHIGINLPLSALHSLKSSGIGEFLDLLPLLDFCSNLKMDVIQLLPLNDSGLDPSPYNALSSLALHPIYLSLHSLPYLEDSSLIKEIEKLRSLNQTSRVRFDKVLSSKMKLLSRYFTLYKEKILSSQEYLSFLKDNSWIYPYSLFKVFKKKYNNAPFTSWAPEEKQIREEDLPSLQKAHAEECSFYAVLQYLCFIQLSTVKKKAQEKKILLKGDIPILISRDSADCWFYPHLFNINLAAGAPPDQYCKEGQYWGFPIFDWGAMRQENFNWWKTRLHYASFFYDLYRIDHTVGLFRLWAIPLGRPSQEGYFFPQDERLWEPLGRELLEMLTTSSSMLPIAEDLGVVPNTVRPLLEELGICGTKVMRWERNWNTDRSFIDPKTYSPISLTCVSTHDSPFLTEWWEKSPEEAKDYCKQKGWDYNPILSLSQRESLLKESISSQSLFHINLFSEYLALLPEFISKDPSYERINIPGTITPFNWTYRFQKPIEEMISNPLLTQAIQKILHNSI